MMVTLKITLRTLPAYRLSFFVTEKAWITTRTPFYYLDLAVPSEVLFKKHFDRVFPINLVATGLVSTCYVRRKQRFHLDDISVGYKGRRDSNLFYRYAMSTERKVDRDGMVLFNDFLGSLPDDALPLTSGEKAVRFMNLATLIGYQQWKDATSANCIVEKLFQYFYPSVIKGIYKKNNEHPLLLKKFWDLFCLANINKFHFFGNIPDAEHLKFILEVANRTQFDFWGFRYGVTSDFTQNIIHHFLRTKRCDFVTMLLDYGFPLGEKFLCDRDCPYNCRKPLTNLFLEYASKEFVHNRFMVWFLITWYEMHRNLLEVPGFIELYQKLFRSLPIPSQPPSMVRKHLEIALEQAPSSSTAVKELTAIYEATDVHPSDCSVVTPPKLSQLSRCVIRQALSANYQLPITSGHSHLPTLLKRFVNLEF